MKKCFIIHGTGGHNNENWFPWLKKKLEEKGVEVLIPNFPQASTPDLTEWFQTMERYKNWIDRDTILVGHSLGGGFLLKYLEKFPTKNAGIFLIASPIGIRPIKFYDGDLRFFGNFSYDWKNIKNTSKKRIVFHSDNDPFVCLENGKKLSKNLNADFHFILNAGHFNKSSGYIKFPELLEVIERQDIY